MSNALHTSYKFKAVTPSDTELLVYTNTVDGGEVKHFCKALYIGGAGDVYAVNDHGDTVAFIGLPSGSVLPIACDLVTSSTTASNIVALF